MNASRASSKSAAGVTSSRPETPSVTPVLPLFLLETMRDRDHPQEVLEEEDVSISMPRRLGLSEVVRQQIQKFAGEVKAKRPQFASQVEDLIRLVIRRPDAEEIFLETGRRVAKRFWAERSGVARGMVRLSPRPLALVAVQRGGRKLLTNLVGPTTFRISRRPLALSIDSSLTARADPGGVACAIYAGAFAELLELYTGRRYRVSHPRCGARGAPACEWTVEIAG